MHPASTEQHRMAAVVAAAARLPKSRRAPDYKRFLETYYGSVDPEDMAARAPAELAGAALAHLKFAHTRRGRALVRVFNPTLREDGYTSPHTVIEVVNDDMPFLVDSIGLALTRASLTMHFLAHPIFAVSRDTAGAAFHRGTRRGHRQASAPGVIPACGGGSHRGSRAPGIAARGYRAEHARCARRLRRLGQDARRGEARFR